MQRIAALLLIALIAPLASAQFWRVGCTRAGVCYGEMTLHGQACTWRENPLGAVRTFANAYWHNGTVCSALSESGRFASVEWSYRNGELWWCDNYDCDWVAGGGFVEGIDNRGNMWGSDSAANSHAVLWLWWPQVQRYDFQQWYRLMSWGEHPYHNQFRRWNGHDFEDVWVAKYDANCDGRIDNFDIDPFVTALLSGDPTCGAFFYTNLDIDRFLEAIAP